MSDENTTVVQNDTLADDSQRTTQPRDASGRFQRPETPAGEPQQPTLPDQQPEGQPELPTPPKFPPALTNLASQYLTDEEIDRIPTPDMLMDVVQGRISRMASARPAPEPKKEPETPKRAPDLAIDDFAMPEEDDETPPIEAVSDYLKKFKTALLSKINEQQRQIAELEGKLGQSAQQSQQIVAQQSAAGWDEVAKSVPGVVEQLGLFSAAIAAPNSPKGRMWAEVAPIVKARADAQGVPPEYVDRQRALVEAWAMYQSLPRNQAQDGGLNGVSGNRPGTAVRGAPRYSAEPQAKKDMTLEEDHQYRLDLIRAERARRGGSSPFA